MAKRRVLQSFDGGLIESTTINLFNYPKEKVVDGTFCKGDVLCTIVDDKVHYTPLVEIKSGLNTGSNLTVMKDGKKFEVSSRVYMCGSNTDYVRINVSLLESLYGFLVTSVSISPDGKSCTIKTINNNGNTTSCMCFTQFQPTWYGVDFVGTVEDYHKYVYYVPEASSVKGYASLRTNYSCSMRIGGKADNTNYTGTYTTKNFDEPLVYQFDGSSGRATNGFLVQATADCRNVTQTTLYLRIDKIVFGGVSLPFKICVDTISKGYTEGALVPAQ